MFGVGLAMAVGAVTAIFISSASEDQNNQGAGEQPQDVSQPDGPQQDQGQQQQQQTQRDSSSSRNNMTSVNATITTMITIPQGAATQQVQEYYQPNPAMIKDGSQITWNNKDIAAHTATATYNNSFDTGIIQPGSSGSATIRGQGEIPYFCTIHPFMKASLQVISD